MLFLYFFMMFIGHHAGAPIEIKHQSGLVITEIMADPTPSFGLQETKQQFKKIFQAEFVELYNGSGVPLNLSNYELSDGSPKPISGILIAPGEYVTVCDDEDTIAFANYGKVAWVSSLSLTNGGEPIVLYDIGGQVIDSVYYSSEWYGSSFKEDGGWSLERVDNDFPCHNEGGESDS